MIDLTNRQFENWFVIGPGTKYRYWLCRCKCGTVREVHASSLTTGKSTNCGCRHKKDLTDRTFGEWTVIKYIGNKKYRCRCSCGQMRDIVGSALTSHRTTSCGHATNGFIDLTGQQIGEWEVLRYAGNRQWECRCSCGKVKNVNGSVLRAKKSLSCGHTNRNNFVDLTDKHFGKLTVLGYAGHKQWECRCECGKISLVYGGNLKSHQTTSCGYCQQTETQRLLLTDVDKLKAYIDDWTTVHKRSIKLIDLSKALNVTESMICYLNKTYDLGIDTSQSISVAQSEIYDYLVSKGFTAELNNRTALNGKELDIYLPAQQLAIEYNGCYWHSPKFKDTKHLLEKTLLCNSKGIRLIHIAEHEWHNEQQRSKIYNLLNNILDIDITTLYARKLKLKAVSTNEALTFLNANHLQKYAAAKETYGLYDGEQLIELMSFGPSRFEHNQEVTELIRLCTLQGYRVVGGAEKLFTAYVKLHPNEKIVSYCDISKFTGSVYIKLGMTYYDRTKPGYIYVNLRTLSTLSRQQCTKQSLLERGLGTEKQTEQEIMYQLGYVQVYNCGNNKYTYNL